MSQNRLECFKRDGFTIFEGAHPPELLTGWRDAYDELCSREGESVWLIGTLEVDPDLFLPAIANPEILDFAEEVMGPFVQLDSLAINAFPSVDAKAASGTVNAWHRDRYSEIPVTRDYTHPLGCNTIFYLHDITDEYGPLRVIPGSHREAIVPERTWRHEKRADELLIYPKAGDVVFTHCNLLHSGTPNTSGRLRYFMSASYNRSFMRHRDGLDGVKTKAVVERARAKGDRRLMRLLGVDEQLWDRCNPYWFTGTDEERWRAWIQEDRAAAGECETNACSEQHVHMAPSRRTMAAG
jgi:hypothetical protein